MLHFLYVFDFCFVFSVNRFLKFVLSFSPSLTDPGHYLTVCCHDRCVNIGIV